MLCYRNTLKVCLHLSKSLNQIGRGHMTNVDPNVPIAAKMTEAMPAQKKCEKYLIFFINLELI